MTLPTDAQERKDTPIFSGVLRYFPNAIAYVALVSKAGNDQHHPGTPLHWDMSKSTDEGDALVRHQVEAGLVDSDGIRHSGKVAWRALAQLERELLADPGRALERAAEHDRHVMKTTDLDQLWPTLSNGETVEPLGYVAPYSNEVEGPDWRP